MFEKCFRRAYDDADFPHFVPREEKPENADYTKMIVEEQPIPEHWRENTERGGWKQFEPQAEAIAAHGGLILEICAGPGGGYAPAVWMQDYNAHVMLSDLCPTVVREWRNHFRGMDNPPPNVAYAALDVCDLPFLDNSLDVVSGSAAVINIEGDRDKALREVYRVLKPGGLFVFDYIFVTEAYYNQMEPAARAVIKERFPTAFWDSLTVFDELGFTEVKTVPQGEWSNENDDSTLADVCRSLGTSLVFSGFVRYCVK